MFVKMDVRSIVSTAFRQLWKFLFVFVLVNAAGLLYLLSVTPAYQSHAKLLVKFGQDARPEVALSQYGGGMSAEEKRGLVQSNVNILTSRDLTEALLADVTVARAYPEIAKNPPERGTVMDAAVRQLSGDIFTKTESDAGIINVSLYNENPDVAAAMLSRLIEIFVSRQSEIYGNPQADVLRDQAAASYQRLEEANRKLYAYKSNSRIASIDEELTLLLKQRGDMAGYLSRRPLEGAGGGFSASALPARIGVGGEAARFPVLDDIQKRLDELRGKEAELMQTYRADSPVLKTLRSNIAHENAALDASVGALNQQIGDLDRQIAQKQRLRATYDDLTRQVNLAEDAYKATQVRLQAAEVNNDLTERKITRISTIEQPEVPLKTSRPNKALVLALCLIIGTAFGIALALMAELLDRTFTRSEQVVAELGVPVLASFAMSRKKKKKFWSRGGGNSILSPRDLISLSQAIDAGLPNQHTRIIYLSSCYGNEGTTTIASELAELAGQSLGRKVLFIDRKNNMPVDKNAAQLARPSLLDVATGKAKLEEAVDESSNKAVSYTYLTPNDNPELILANLDKLRQTLSLLRQSYNLIVIPAAGVITNPALIGLSSLADGIVMVIEAENTRAPVARHALEVITKSGAHVIGTVLNKQRYYIPGWLYNRM